MLKRSGGSIFVESGRSVFHNFGSVEEECHALRNGAGIRDLSDEGIICCTGSDTADYLHRVTTNNIKGTGKNHITRTLFTTDKGRIVDLATVFPVHNDIILIGSGIYHSKLMRWIDKYLIMEDMHIRSATGQYAALSVTGPKAGALVSETGYRPLESSGAGSIQQFNVQGKIIFGVKIRENFNQFLLITEAPNGEFLLKSLMESGDIPARLVGEEAYTIFRIEQGIPASPTEINEDVNPHEAGLLNEVDFDKGCYIGQEVIARLDTYDKVQKHMRGFRVTGDAVISPGTELFSPAGKIAGMVTSAAYSPGFSTFIGMGLIRKALEQRGTRLYFRDSHKSDNEIIITGFPINASSI
ncbi:YgfZ/GcvT domain-containing protein [candidate division KSB1 bacterium]